MGHTSEEMAGIKVKGERQKSKVDSKMDRKEQRCRENGTASLCRVLFKVLGGLKGEESTASSLLEFSSQCRKPKRKPTRC